jgi:hypothetical protein
MREESTARQRLAKSTFHSNEHACKNQSVASRLTHVLWKRVKQIITDEMFKVVVCLRFTSTYKREFIREFIRKTVLSTIHPDN